MVKWAKRVFHKVDFLLCPCGTGIGVFEMRKWTAKLAGAAAALCMVCALPFVGFASPETLPASYGGNCNWLLEVKNPEGPVTSTTNKTCVISAVGVQGTTVTLYAYNQATSQFEKMYVDGVPLEAVIGASGLFAQPVTLHEDLNKFLVLGTNGDNQEVVWLDVKLLGEGFLDKIKSFTIVGTGF